MKGASGISANSFTAILGDVDYQFSASTRGASASFQVVPANVSGIAGADSAVFEANGVVYEPTSASTGTLGSGAPVTISYGPTVPTTYNLTAAAASPLHLGSSTIVTATITNAGSWAADSLNYAGLSLNTSGGLLSGQGLPISGGWLWQGAQNSGSLTYTATVPGTITLTPVVSSATNATIGGNASLSSTFPATVGVFSGSGVWNSSHGSLWTANDNWVDANGSGVQAAPGTFAGFANTDTATFSGSGSVTAIDLTGVNPSLNALSFSNSSYTLTGGSLTLTSTNGAATVTVSSGTQSINTPMAFTGNANFAINGGAMLLNSTISGSGGLTKSGSGGLTLSGADTLSVTGPIAVNQGTVAAPLGIPHGGGGITLAAGSTLQAGGQVNRAVSGNGTVTATAELIVGNATQSGQFNQGGASGVGGTLNAGGNAVAIFSADTAILGSQTNLGAGGSLTALNGAQLGNPSSVDSTKILTATGSATINANFVNNGVVNGPIGSGQELTFTQAVQGAGNTTGNIEYAASYRVGNSPDAVSVQNVLLDSTSTLIMELGGDVPGTGYDQLDISGLATLNGTLDVELLNGFSPSLGESFTLFSGRTTGSFSQIGLPALSNGEQWNTSNLSTNGTISVTPEPSSLALLAAGGAIGLAGYKRRRKVKCVKEWRINNCRVQR